MHKEHTGLWIALAGKWNQFKGNVRKQWGNLTDDDLEYIAGKRENLLGKLQERYGYAREEAERQVDQWAENVKY